MLLRHRIPIGCRFTAARSRRALSGIDTYYYSNSRHPGRIGEVYSRSPEWPLPTQRSAYSATPSMAAYGPSGSSGTGRVDDGFGSSPSVQISPRNGQCPPNPARPHLAVIGQSAPGHDHPRVRAGGDKTGSLSGGTEGSNPLPPVESQARTSAPLIPFRCFCRETRARGLGRAERLNNPIGVALV